MTAPTPAQLHHLAARARDGVALPAEHDALANGITAMAERLEQAERVARSAARDASAALTAQLTAEAAIERVRATTNAITQQAAEFAQHHNPACECEWAEALTQTADRIRDALDQAQQPTTGTHRYLSTGCLHGQHTYCQSHTGQSGTKTPATCKFCTAPCTCPCHTT